MCMQCLFIYVPGPPQIFNVAHALKRLGSLGTRLYIPFVAVSSNLKLINCCRCFLAHNGDVYTSLLWCPSDENSLALGKLFYYCIVGNFRGFNFCG